MTSAVLSAPMYRPRHTPEPPYLTPMGVRRIESGAQLRELLATVQDRRRHLPVIVTSPHGKAPLIRLGAVREAVGDQAVFVELTNQVAADWQEQWPDLCAFGGATRLFAPSTANRSRLLRTYPDDDPRDTENEIISWIRGKEWLDEPTRVVQPRLTAVVRDAKPRRNSTTTEAVRREDKHQIELLENRNREFESIVRGDGLFADPADRFHFEVELAYLRCVPEFDRGTWELAEIWTASGEFIAQVDEHAKAISRDTILRAVIDVLTGRARETGRQVRAHRTGPGGDDPQAVRADGARAFRCNVQSSTAAARRLIWWQYADGRIELANIAAHDNSRI